MTARALPALLTALFLALSIATPARAQDAPLPGEPADEPSIEELEEQMIPTLVLPEFRVRLGGGVSIQTSGASNVFGRVSEEFEWLPADLEFLLFGIGAAQSFTGRSAIYQVGGRVGAHATFCTDSLVMCSGAITLQLGVIAGAVSAQFDLSADADLRFLFARVFELFVRGGFTTAGTANTFANITAGVAIAF